MNVGRINLQGKSHLGRGRATFKLIEKICSRTDIFEMDIIRKCKAQIAVSGCSSSQT